MDRISDYSEEYIHNKRSKTKQNAKGLKPLGKTQKAKDLKEGSTGESLMQTQEPQHQKAQGSISKHRLRKMRANGLIDEFLEQLLREELINQDYWSYHAKAIHTLGIQRCNRLAINARNGRDPQSLYAYKIKSAMQSHFYKQFNDEE